MNDSYLPINKLISGISDLFIVIFIFFAPNGYIEARNIIIKKREIMKRQEIVKLEESNRAYVMKEIDDLKEYGFQLGISLWISCKG